MKHRNLFINYAFPALATLALISCGDGNTTSETATTDTAQKVATPIVSIADFPSSVEFNEAKLAMEDVKVEEQGTDSVKLTFNFKVSNYELKAQTTDAESMQCNNSKDGQHIHFIMDNAPYKALYEPKNQVTLAKNSEHSLVAFLSRSYHQSIKSPGAALLYNFKIDEQGKLQKLATPKSPMLTYSRPKGDYLGKDIDNLLLDFYLWNATLGADYTVKAQVTGDGVDTAFILNEWKSYLLKNLPLGSNTIKLTLLDKAGNKVEGVSTEISRTIKLATDEPMK